MKASLVFTIIFCFLQTSFAESVPASTTFQTQPIPFLAQPQAKLNPPTAIQKKRGLKERILIMWFEKKLQRRASEDKRKKQVKFLGYSSLAAAVLALIFFFLLFSFISEGLFMLLLVLFIALIPASIILGILSLTKRKKLADKNGTSMIPALTGLIIGGGFLVLYLITLLSFFIG